MSKFPDYRMDGRWIRSLRGERSRVEQMLPYGYFNEEEPSLEGNIERVSAILLINQECPYSCLMCDLWKHTTIESVPTGAIPAQIQYALEKLAPATHLKLTNRSWPEFIDSSRCH